MIKEKNEIATIAEPSMQGSILAVIAKAAADPSVDVAKMEALLAMQERVMNKQAEIDFNQAMARLDLPVIDKKGKIEFTDKKGELRNTPFAKYEDIDEVIRPLLKAENFTISFDTIPKDGGGVILTGTLSHVSGHKKTASTPIALDTSGSKNNIQAMGSSISYGKRYVVGMLLNLITKGEDSDGVDLVTVITTEQAVEIDLLISQTKSDKAKFMQYMGVADIRDIKAAHYQKAMTALNAKKAKAQ